MDSEKSLGYYGCVYTIMIFAPVPVVKEVKNPSTNRKKLVN